MGGRGCLKSWFFLFPRHSAYLIREEKGEGGVKIDRSKIPTEERDAGDESHTSLKLSGIYPGQLWERRQETGAKVPVLACIQDRRGPLLLIIIK